MFRQSAGTYVTQSQGLLWNTECAEGDNFSVLGLLSDDMKMDGKFEFKMVWPNRDGRNTQHWRQTSNPVTSINGGVEGFECLDCAFHANNFGGLEWNTADTSVLDGSVDYANAFYAIGQSQAAGAPDGAIWGAEDHESRVELFVKTEHPVAHTHAVDERPWNLVFRQTAGTYMARGDWFSHNAADP
jgi:hypothetical protein